MSFNLPDFGEFYWLGEQISCQIYGRGENTPTEFLLENPNGKNTFQFSIKEIQKSLFTNGKGNKKRGYCEYRLNLSFDYNNHWMELHKLLLASKITITFPTPYGFPNTYDFLLSNSEVVKKWLGNNPVTKRTKSRFFGLTDVDKSEKKYWDVRDANPVPDGGVTLEFTSVLNFKPSDISNIIWFEQVVEPPAIAFWFGDPNTLLNKTSENDGSFESKPIEGSDTVLSAPDGNYYYIEVVEGDFISSIVGYLDQPATIVRLGEDPNTRNDVYAVYTQIYSVRYDIRAMKLGEQSENISALIEYLYNIKVATSDLNGEELSKYITLENISRSIVHWDFRNNIYIELNELKSGYENIVIQYSLNGGVDWSNISYNTFEDSVSYLYFSPPVVGQAIDYRVLETTDIPNSVTSEVQVLIRFITKAILSNLQIAGDNDSDLQPTSTTLDEENDIIAIAYVVKNYVYVKTSEANLDNTKPQYSTNGGVSWTDIPNSLKIVEDSKEYWKCPISVFGSSYHIRILNTLSSNGSSFVEVNADYPLDLRYEVTPDYILDPSTDLTCTRAGDTATYIDSNGDMQVALADTVRIDHNSDGSYKGVLVEDVGFNYCGQSEIVAAPFWDGSGVGRWGHLGGLGSGYSFNGGQTNDAYAIIEDGNNTIHVAYYVVAGISGVANNKRTSVSFAVKSGSTNFIRIKSQAGGSIFGRVDVDLSDNSYTTDSTGDIVVDGVSITNLKDGWRRVELSIISPTLALLDFAVVGITELDQPYVNSVADSEYTGVNGAVSFYFTRAMFNQTNSSTVPVFSSYIPNNSGHGSVVTRNADNISISNFSDWYRTQGTLLVEYSTPVSLATEQTVLFLHDGTSSNWIYVADWRDSNNQIRQTVKYNGNEEYAQNIAYTLGSDRIVRSIISLKNDNVKGSVNGSSVVNDESITVPLLNNGDIGRYPFGFNVEYLNGHFKSLRFYNKVFGDEDIQALSNVSSNLDSFNASEVEADILPALEVTTQRADLSSNVIPEYSLDNGLTWNEVSSYEIVDEAIDKIIIGHERPGEEVKYRLLETVFGYPSKEIAITTNWVDESINTIEDFESWAQEVLITGNETQNIVEDFESWNFEI